MLGPVIVGVFGLLRQALSGRLFLPAPFRLVFRTCSLFRGRRCRYLTEIVLIGHGLLVAPKIAVVIPRVAFEGITYAVSMLGIWC